MEKVTKEQLEQKEKDALAKQAQQAESKEVPEEDLDKASGGYAIPKVPKPWPR